MRLQAFHFHIGSTYKFKISRQDPSRDATLTSLLEEEEARVKDSGLVISTQEAPLPATTISEALDIEDQQ